MIFYNLLDMKNPCVQNSLKEEFPKIFKNYINESQKYTEKEKKIILNNFEKLLKTNMNILFLGRTGVGKSSTINDLFKMNVANINFVKSCTNEITKYKLGNLNIYDSPGLGESKEKDEYYKKIIIDFLEQKDSSGNQLIDMVVYIFDASSRDNAESITFINEILTPILGGESKRLLIALNKIDIVDGGFYFNKELNKPEIELENRLKEKIKYLKSKLNLDFEIIYYCAGIEYGKNKIQPYNINSFFEYWSKNVSEEKRKIILLNLKEDNFKKENISYETIKNVSKITLGIGLGLLGIAGICVVGARAISLIHTILNSQIFLKGLEFCRAFAESQNSLKHSLSISYLVCSCANCESKRFAEGFNFMVNFVSEKKDSIKNSKGLISSLFRY